MPSSPPPASEPKKQPSAAAAAEEKLSNEKTIPSTKALNGVPFDPSADGTPTGLVGETPSGVETTQSVAQQPLPSEKILYTKASSGKPFTWTEVRSCRYFLGVPDSHGAMLFVVLVSVPYALLTPWLVRRVAGQPTVFVWTIAILASSYFFIGAIRFTVTMGFWAIFFRISYVALLSVAATHFIGANSGAAVAVLLTFYAAGVFGHTIAEYIHRAESEAMVSPPSGCREDQKQQSVCKEDQKQQSVGKEDQGQQSGSKEDQGQQSGSKEDQINEPLMCFLFVQGVMSLFVLMRMVSVVFFPGSVMFAVATEDDLATEALMVVNEFSLETLFLAWPWATFMAMMQEETVVTVKTMLFKVGAYIAALYILSGVLSIALGDAYGLLALWSTVMAMVGLFGYILGMFAPWLVYFGTSLVCLLATIISVQACPQVEQSMGQKVPDESEDKCLAA